MEDTNVTGGEVTADGFTVSSNVEKSDAIRENLASEPKPEDGEPEDPEKAEAEKRSKAASVLGKEGGKAAAEARADKAAKEPEKAEAKPKNGEDDAELAEKGDKEGHPRDSATARVREATRKLSDERKAREAAEAEVARLKAEQPAPKKPATETKADDDPEPMLDGREWDSYEQWVTAHSRWDARQEFKKLRKQDEEVQQRDAALVAVRKRTGAFSERVLAAEKADPTLHDRVDVEFLKELMPTYALRDPKQQQAINVLSEAIIDSEQGAELLVYLSENKDERDRIKRLPNYAAVIRAVVQLEALVSKEAEPAPKAETKPETYVSGAKPPVKPLPTSVVGSEDFSDDDDLGEHIRKAEALEKRQRAGR